MNPKAVIIVGLLMGLIGGAAFIAVAGTDGPDGGLSSLVPGRGKLVNGGQPTALLAGRTIETSTDAPAFRRPIAVMVDNSGDALPQSGLDRADVVIEALVEGGITRLMAVYHSQDAARVGPVRSARTPFLHWALEFDAIYAHAGSSEETGDANAGLQIQQWNVSDLDYLGSNALTAAFQRDADREAPHNLYTTTSALRAAAESRSYNRAPRFQAWTFESGQTSGPARSPANRITVGFGSGSPHTVRWDWDANTKTYLRTQSGRPHTDATTGRQLTASNVIVQYARAYIADSVGHVLIDNLGQGRATVFMDGTAVEAIWRKTDDASRTRYYSQTGIELSFRPGATWVEVVDLSGGVRIE